MQDFHLSYMHDFHFSYLQCVTDSDSTGLLFFKPQGEQTDMDKETFMWLVNDLYTEQGLPGPLIPTEADRAWSEYQREQESAERWVHEPLAYLEEYGFINQPRS